MHTRFQHIVKIKTIVLKGRYATSFSRVRRLLAHAGAWSRGLPWGSMQSQSLSLAALAHGLFSFRLAYERGRSTPGEKKKARPAVWRGQALSLVGVRRLYFKHIWLIINYTISTTFDKILHFSIEHSQ